jgi:arylsulfatase A
MSALVAHSLRYDRVKQVVWVILLAFSATLASARGAQPQGGRPELPNIIFIMADDLGYGGLGCYGATQIPTPHCDRLAREGMRFTDAHSPSAVCTPTRYSVLTGRYNWRSWLQNWVLMEHMPLLVETDRPTVASLLKEKGYATGCFGKWHLGWGDKPHHSWDGELKPGPLEVGFDTFFGVPFSHNSSKELRVFVKDRRILGPRKLANTAVEISAQVTSFIKANARRPFFLYYPTTGIHAPHTPHSQFRGKTKLGDYADFVVEFDWALGETLAALERAGIADNTLVIVTSDNGAKANWNPKGHKPNGDWRGDKGTIYEGGHRVPFIARWPGHVPAGTICNETICHVDLMATCAAIAGIPVPSNAAEDSYNLLPALRGESVPEPIREATVHHSVSGLFAIREGKWKFIDGRGDGFRPIDWPKTNASGHTQPRLDPETGRFKPFRYYWAAPKVSTQEAPGQLYDLDADPRETENLFRKHPEVVVRLRALLTEYRQEGRSVARTDNAQGNRQQP